MAKVTPKCREKIEKALDLHADGLGIMKALKKSQLSWSEFKNGILTDADLSRRYARAKDLWLSFLAEETLDISDSREGDVIVDEATGKPIVNHNVIQRDRLRVDTRKWLLSKLVPKKYGDKIDVTSDGKKLEVLPPWMQNKPETDTTEG